MAKRKKHSKAQKRKAATARPKARKISKAARGQATKRTVAKAKPKKAARKQPAAPVVETVAETAAAEVIEQPVAVTNEASTGPAV
jgi:hypothetical protein